MSAHDRNIFVQYKLGFIVKAQASGSISCNNIIVTNVISKICESGYVRNSERWDTRAVSQIIQIVNGLVRLATQCIRR